MRMLTVALLLASATTVPALAQSRGSDWREAAEPGPRREWPRHQNSQSTDQPAYQGRVLENREQRRAEVEPDRAPRGRWGGGGVTPPAAPPVAQAIPPVGSNGNRNWRGGRGDVLTTTPPVYVPPAGNDRRWAEREERRNRGDNRRWDRGDDRGWDRDRGERHADAQNGRWHRDADGRWGRHNDHDWIDRDWRSGRDNRNWNRSWRSDRRYDWQHYRNLYRDRYRAPRYYNPYGYRHGYQRFGIGIYLESLYFGSRYWLTDPWDYRLPPAPFGCRWVRYYDDVLLVDTRTGYVVDVIYDFFW